MEKCSVTLLILDLTNYASTWRVAKRYESWKKCPVRSKNINTFRLPNSRIRAVITLRLP
jgi:hypothetical protein